MKSCTDLEQSKKLSEFLSHESADMQYTTNSGDCPYLLETSYTGKSSFGTIIIPSWSLTALFGVMPQINDWIIPHGHKNDKLSQFEPKICKIWEHSIIPSYKVTYGNGLSTDIYDNPVDAAFEMVLKLHELKLL